MQRSLQQAAVATGSARSLAQHTPASSSCAGSSTTANTIIKSSAARSSNGFSRIRGSAGNGTDSISFIAKHTTPSDAFHLLHCQEAEVAAVLPSHRMIAQPLAINTNDGRVQTLCLSGPSLVTHHKRVWSESGSDLKKACSKVFPVAEAVATCATDAMCHLSKHDVIHGCINFEAFIIHKERSTGKLVAKMTDFGASRVKGIAHAPGATDLSTIPSEKVHECFLGGKEFIIFSKAGHDMRGLAFTLLNLLCPTGAPAVFDTDTYGIMGQFSDPMNFPALAKACKALRFNDLWAWVRANYPPVTLYLLHQYPRLENFIARCLAPEGKRWTASEAAQHLLVSQHIADLPDVCARLAQQQEPAIQAITGIAASLFEELSEFTKSARAPAAASEPASKTADPPTPTKGMSLLEYRDLLRERHAGNPCDLQTAMDLAAQSVFSCGVTSLLRYKEQGKVHLDICADTFRLVEEGPKGPIFQLAAPCPGALELASIPSEMMSVVLSDPASYASLANRSVHDIWGVGTAVLEFYSDIPLSLYYNELYGLKGDLAAPSNRAALQLAVSTIEYVNPIHWMDDYDSAALRTIPDDCMKVLKRCLNRLPEERCTPEELSKSSFLRRPLFSPGTLRRNSKTKKLLYAAILQHPPANAVLVKPYVSSYPVTGFNKSPQAGDVVSPKGQSRLRVAVGKSMAAAAGSGVEGVCSTSSSSSGFGVPTPVLAGGPLLRQCSSSCGGFVSSGAAPSSSVVPAAWRLRKQPLVASVAMPARGSSSLNSSSSEQVSGGKCGLGQVDVDTIHNRLAVSAGCESADLLVLGCHRVTGEMPRPMLMVQFAPTLTCPQSEVVRGPMVASSGSSRSSAVSVSGKACKLLRAARSVCGFFVRR